MSIIKSHIGKMRPYTPPLEGRDPHSFTLLDFNERTVPVGKFVREALVNFIQAGRMQVYPSYGNTVERIAEYAQVDPGQLMLTNGSDQGIELVFRTTCREGDQAIIAAPTFAMYPQCAGVENLEIIQTGYAIEHGYPVAETLKRITPKTRVITIANPNNPCGSKLAKEQILRIARAAPHAAILVDECYFEYCRETVVDSVEEYKNIFVTRTFSKTWGLPSLRLGYLISARENITALLNVRGPYDVNQFAVVAVQAALDHPQYTEDYVREVMQVSRPLLENCLREKNVLFWPSSANFIWAFPEDPQAVEKALQAEGILVRPKADLQGRMGLRITLGDKKQTQSLVAVLEQSLS